MPVKRDSLIPIEFGGLQIFDFTAGQNTSSSMALIEVPAGVRHAEAWSQRSDKYYLVVAGTIGFVLDGAAFDLGAGDFCLVRQGRHFSYANTTAEPATLVLVHTPSFDLTAEQFA